MNRKERRSWMKGKRSPLQEFAARGVNAKIDKILAGDEKLRLRYHFYDYISIEGALKKAEEGTFFVINNGHVTELVKEDVSNDVLDQKQMGQEDQRVRDGSRGVRGV